MSSILGRCVGIGKNYSLANNEANIELCVRLGSRRKKVFCPYFIEILENQGFQIQAEERVVINFLAFKKLSNRNVSRGETGRTNGNF